MNDNLQSEINSQTESQADIQDLKNKNLLLQSELETLSNNSMATEFQHEIESLKIELDKFTEKASMAAEIEIEVRSLRNIRND